MALLFCLRAERAMSLFKYFNTSCIPFKVSPIYPKSFCCLQEDCTFTSPVSNNTTQFFKGFFNFLVFIYPKVTRQLRGNDDMNVLQASLAALRCKSLPPRRNRNLRCNAVGRGGIISWPSVDRRYSFLYVLQENLLILARDCNLSDCVRLRCAAVSTFSTYIP